MFLLIFPLLTIFFRFIYVFFSIKFISKGFARWGRVVRGKWLPGRQGLLLGDK
jgi:hypothetical protein